jgi:hypothetical protein
MQKDRVRTILGLGYLGNGGDPGTGPKAKGRYWDNSASYRLAFEHAIAKHVDAFVARFVSGLSTG